MDVLTFITKLVAALAWPIVGAMLVLALRPHFGELTRRLVDLRVGRLRATFVREAIQAAPEVKPPPAPPVIDASPSA
jgi:hypothetical protein